MSKIVPVSAWEGRYEGRFEVSSAGTVYAVARRVATATGSRSVPARIVEPQPMDIYGHLGVRLWDGQQSRLRPLHLLVLWSFTGRREPGMLACHRNGKGFDNRLSNLYWGTHADNMADMVRHGTHNMARRKACPLGHDLVAPNLSPSHLRAGKRTCRACHFTRSRILYAAKCGRPAPELRVLADEVFAEIMGRTEAPPWPAGPVPSRERRRRLYPSEAAALEMARAAAEAEAAAVIEGAA